MNDFDFAYEFDILELKLSENYLYKSIKLLYKENFYSSSWYWDNVDASVKLYINERKRLLFPTYEDIFADINNKPRIIYLPFYFR